MRTMEAENARLAKQVEMLTAELNFCAAELARLKSGAAVSVSSAVDGGMAEGAAGIGTAASISETDSRFAMEWMNAGDEGYCQNEGTTRPRCFGHVASSLPAPPRLATFSPTSSSSSSSSHSSASRGAPRVPRHHEHSMRPAPSLADDGVG